ncbi:zinc/iron-chelating domain-containing protein [Dissulfurispira thermophila]|uniref:Zinc/iron-chelating domain-containing protein n=2 Tax=root TaxID=1 RepID=A0A7G1GZ00_9BACT|nr:YkgJ family cysteine cluster protein [Dissulfurispira thermophila]BCB95604.1 zinc/iron-chelating domain-containing protein [Dissulfurispira thermophila]
MKDNNVKGRLEILTPQGLENSDKPQKMRLNKRTSCIRCGKCCSESSPSLMKADISLFISGVLSHDNTYTIRYGERVRSNVDDNIYESFIELIKIKNKEGTSICIFYKDNEGCSIYENRPSQCRAYKCWSPENLINGLEKNALKRSDIFGSIDLLMDVIGKHEEKCSYAKLSDAFDRLAEGIEDAVEDIIDMLQYDTYIRPFLKEKFNVPSTAMDLILGKPLIDTINAFGFKVEINGEEYTLSPIEPIKEMEGKK